jgi:hypothetical protein
MQQNHFGPRKRAVVCRIGMALLFGAILSGCQSPQLALQELATVHSRHVETLASIPFPLAFSAPPKQTATPLIRVYLEGDGHAWATRSQPSLDPSPRSLLVARLAFDDPLPSAYLARPCQFIKANGCTPSLWTNRRFAPEVVGSLDHALTLIKSRYGNDKFELIGYSGGAALALLLAAQRNDIAQVQTLAGNLSPRQWAQLQQLTPLTGSMEPLDQRRQLLDLPQRHLAGANDNIVPPQLMRSYMDTLGPAACLESAVLPKVSHTDGWQLAWIYWRDRPLSCRPRQSPQGR